jgi:hypothetical protein
MSSSGANSARGLADARGESRLPVGQGSKGSDDAAGTKASRRRWTYYKNSPLLLVSPLVIGAAALNTRTVFTLSFTHRLTTFAMYYKLPLLLLGLAGVLASPVVDIEKRATEVTIANGTVIGGVNGNVEFFKGIPYAEPPVGDLRFERPKPFSTNFGRLNGTQPALQCLQGGVSGSVEDCLTLQVLRPTGTSPLSNLPVVVFIHGGAFSGGGAEAGNDLTPLVKKSVDLQAPIVVVSIQYRLGALGFLAGKEIAAEGNTNLGLRDQRLALRWVQGMSHVAFAGQAPGLSVEPTQTTLARSAATAQRWSSGVSAPEPCLSPTI